MSLSADQIAGYAASAGFSGAALDVAVAVALAESSGNPSAVNPEGSYGLWQIYLKDHPEFAGWNLLDPQVNANAAFSVFAAAGGSFAPWTTYRTGAYTAFMGGYQQVPEGLPAESSEAEDASIAPSTAPDFATVAMWGALVAGGLIVYGRFAEG